MVFSPPSGLGLWRDPFSALPPEINIQILGYLSLHDMQSAISCSLMLSRTFTSNRRYILEPHLRELQLSYGDISLFHLAAAAMHLRELHSKHDGDTISVLEMQVEPVMDYILRLNAKTIEERRNISLYMAIAAKDLLPEIIDAFTTGLKIRHRYQSPDSLWPAKAPLGLRAAFTDGFLRFDCYRSIFHYKGQGLFQERACIKDDFLNSFPPFPNFDDKILRMYPYMILGKIRPRYHKIMKELDSRHPRFGRGVVWPKGAWKKYLATTDIINYRNRTTDQHDYFVHRLLLQGYPKLMFFEQLSPETLWKTMNEEFEELVVSNLEDCQAWTAYKGFHYYNLHRHFILWGYKRQERDNSALNRLLFSI
ncbi:hypothetical protein FPCIR_11538 [Fusarium pseudocircinatum]|uniref:F-box domain-containing protein n=1 Tax=Fusarium pseudocircinatum TaxID=56676 RepID=A0A8H5NTU0_9HYPO|nr:hypothetical protein FPCIR_11538 [Fusarium pseudocircinatum]